MKTFILAASSLALASGADWQSAIKFRSSSGAIQKISFDGTDLNVPGYCRASSCTAQANAISTNGDAALVNAQDIAMLRDAQVAERKAMLAENAALKATVANQGSLLSTLITRIDAQEKTQTAGVALLKGSTITNAAQLEKLELASLSADQELTTAIAKVAELGQTVELEREHDSIVQSVSTLRALHRSEMDALQSSTSSDMSRAREDIDGINQAMRDEHDAFRNADSDLKSADAALRSADSQIRTALLEENTSRQASDAVLRAEDANIRAALLREDSARKADDATLRATITEAVANEDAARKAADVALEAKIAALTAKNDAVRVKAGKPKAHSKK